MHPFTCASLALCHPPSASSDLLVSLPAQDVTWPWPTLTTCSPVPSPPGPQLAALLRLQLLSPGAVRQGQTPTGTELCTVGPLPPCSGPWHSPKLHCSPCSHGIPPECCSALVSWCSPSPQTSGFPRVFPRLKCSTSVVCNSTASPGPGSSLGCVGTWEGRTGEHKDDVNHPRAQGSLVSGLGTALAGGRSLAASGWPGVGVQ